MLNNSGVNKVLLMGRVGADPSTQQVNGQQILCFPLITIEKLRRNGQEERHEEWHQVKINALLTKPEDVAKGKVIYLQGRLQTHRYTDENQVKLYKTEVIAYSIEAIDVRLMLV